MVAPAVICIGMAGSGKTTFLQRLNSHLHGQKKPPYVINLDPAVLSVPFHTNIDIRDSINYKQVMKQYNLGPNGGIMTSLNLFATKIDQVLSLVEKRSNSVDYILIDTPGQIECFVWSASGAIITDSLASTVPTVIAYIVDTPRSSSPTTFMSNMLYACSILYKTKLPLIIVFNKTDEQDADFAMEWMKDFESFQAALRRQDEEPGSSGGGYMSSLMNSMSLMLDEFYKHLDAVGVSSYTGDGMDEFLEAVDRKVQEYETEYKAERERIIKEREKAEEKNRQKNLSKLMKDMGINNEKKNKTTPGESSSSEVGAQTISDAEDEEEEEEIDEYEGILSEDEEPGLDDSDDEEQQRLGPQILNSLKQDVGDTSLQNFLSDEAKSQTKR